MATDGLTPLREMIDGLARRAWSSAAALEVSQFQLDLSVLKRRSSNTQFVEAFLEHARSVAPGFNVPFMVPRVTIAALSGCAGQFNVDGEGYVSITVGSDFFTDLDAAAAILAHEVCHYLLENNGIRAHSREANERLTDACMFVCGFGNVFRRGYLRPTARGDYRPGHRLGYLTDQEYQFAEDHVAALRRSNSLGLPDELQELRRKLSNRVPDAAARKRLLDHKRRTLPLTSEADLYREVLDEFCHR